MSNSFALETRQDLFLELEWLPSKRTHSIRPCCRSFTHFLEILCHIIFLIFIYENKND